MADKFYTYRRTNKVTIILSLFSFCLFLFLLVNYLKNGEGSSILLAILSPTLLILFAFKNNRYFIEFQDEKLFLNIPKHKKEIINFESIENINVKMFEVELTIKNEEKPITLDLNNCKDDTRQVVKTKFNTLAGRLK